MFRETLEKIIGRAAMDAQFRQRMIENPEVAFKEYNLTEEQILAIKAIPADALEKFASQLTKIIGRDQSEA
ncbi:MAG: Franean1_4349 family RiPP [Deltaproteobacteria bacterium]|nr:Franean1_4349 family RiPP [Deltaproteobacteria bacterium]